MTFMPSRHAHFFSDIEIIKNKKCVPPYSENVTPLCKVDTMQRSIHNQVTDGLDYILSHLDGYPFPRTIMTKRLGCQIEVINTETLLVEFQQSNYLDCRIAAYPAFPRYKGLNFVAPSIVFIDLDLAQFKDLSALDRTLKRILKRIQNTAIGRACPTVLWTGNGYHIYLPIAGLVLEEESVFAEFNQTGHDQPDLTTKFMRFAEQYFTNGKQDPNHKPSVNNCLLRVPGTYNSKDGQQVRIVQEWNGYRVPIQYMIREFRRYLIQERMDEPQIAEASTHRNTVNGNEQQQSIYWIDRLLQTPIADQRKYCIWRILAPYLVKVKRLSNDSVCTIIEAWLDECDKLQRISFYSRSRVNDDVRRARQGGYYPIGYNNLKTENPLIYAIVTGEKRLTN